MLLDTQGTPLICPVLPPTAHLIPSGLMSRLATDHPLWLVADDDAHGGHDAIVGAAPVRFSHALTLQSRWESVVHLYPPGAGRNLRADLFLVADRGHNRLWPGDRAVGPRLRRRLTHRQTHHGTATRSRRTTPHFGHTGTPRRSPPAIPALPHEYRTGDEIEDLAATFAAMRVVLEENLRTIRSQQHELIRREKLASVGQLLAALAHDLRNPLGVIRSSAQVVLEGPQDEPIRQEMARYIIDEVDKLSQRLHNFLRYARQKPPDFADCAAEDVLRAAFEAVGGAGRA